MKSIDTARANALAFTQRAIKNGETETSTSVTKGGTHWTVTPSLLVVSYIDGRQKVLPISSITSLHRQADRKGRGELIVFAPNVAPTFLSPDDRPTAAEDVANLIESYLIR